MKVSPYWLYDGVRLSAGAYRLLTNRRLRAGLGRKGRQWATDQVLNFDKSLFLASKIFVKGSY